MFHNLDIKNGGSTDITHPDDKDLEAHNRPELKDTP